MRIRTLPLAAVLLAAGTPLRAQTQTPAPAPARPAAAAPAPPAPGSAEMFAFFTGRWGCQGAFANGRATAADVTFAPQLDGRWLEYRHADRAPGRFQAVAHWGTDPATGTLVSVMEDNSGGVRLFTAAGGWADSTVVFERHDLLAPPRYPERFTFHAQGPDTFRMEWSVSRNGQWLLGDYLVCTRQH